MYLREIIAKNIRRIRVEQDKNQEDLGKLLRVKPPYISEIESGRQNISVDTLERIAKALDVHPSELLIVDPETKDIGEVLQIILILVSGLTKRFPPKG